MKIGGGSIIIGKMGASSSGASVLGFMLFLLFFGVGGDLVIEILTAKGKVNGFRISSIIVSSTGGIISIIVSIIGGISVRGISVGGHVFLVLGAILQH